MHPILTGAKTMPTNARRVSQLQLSKPGRSRDSFDLSWSARRANAGVSLWGVGVSGYTKLSSSLIASSVWAEPDKTRIVWITMLAMADQNGDVKAAVPGLAHLARETVQDTLDAITKLSAPDPDSGRKELEGRRIVPIEGGWHLVTHPYYREEGMSEEARRYWRDKKREYRKSKNVQDIPRKSRKSRTSGYGYGNVSVPVPKERVKGVRGKQKPENVDELVCYCLQQSLTENDGRWLWDKWEANGWKNGGKPILNYEATIRQWKRQGDIFPSQRPKQFGKAFSGRQTEAEKWYEKKYGTNNRE